MTDYPEHDKLSAIKDQTQAIGEFLEWAEARGMFLAEYPEGHNFAYPVQKGNYTLIGEWSGIDLDKIEAEKRQMLESIRAQQAPKAS